MDPEVKSLIYNDEQIISKVPKPVKSCGLCCSNWRAPRSASWKLCRCCCRRELRRLPFMAWAISEMSAWRAHSRPPAASTGAAMCFCDLCQTVILVTMLLNSLCQCLVCPIPHSGLLCGRAPLVIQILKGMTVVTFQLPQSKRALFDRVAGVQAAAKGDSPGPGGRVVQHLCAAPEPGDTWPRGQERDQGGLSALLPGSGHLGP